MLISIAYTSVGIFVLAHKKMQNLFGQKFGRKISFYRNDIPK